MRVLQHIAPGTVSVVDLPVPDPEPDEILVRVEAISTCPQWDLHIIGGVPMFEDRPLKYPYVPGEPGHEFAGVVERCGSSVDDYIPGQRVAAWRDPGNRRQGAYAEYVCVKADHVLAIPSDLPIEAVAPLELAMCVQVSLDQLIDVDAVEGKSVMVSGLGPAGLIAVQMAKAYGASSVSAIEPEVSRRELGLSLGADEVFDPRSESLADSRFDTGLDTTGLKAVIEHLMSITTTTVAIFGVLRERVEFGPEKWWGNFRLMGYGEHNKEAAVRALKLIAEGRLDLRPLLSRQCTFETYAAGVEALRNKSAVKVLVYPGHPEE